MASRKSSQHGVAGSDIGGRRSERFGDDDDGFIGDRRRLGDENDGFLGDHDRLAGEDVIGGKLINRVIIAGRLVVELGQIHALKRSSSRSGNFRGSRRLPLPQQRRKPATPPSARATDP